MDCIYNLNIWAQFMTPKGAMQELDPVLFGSRFREVREGLGLSRAELALAAGYSSEQIRRVEAGLKLPGAQLLASLMELGGDVRYVLGAVAEEQRDTIESLLQAGLYAQQREALRTETRIDRETRRETKGRVLTDQERDLVDAWRELSRDQRREVVAFVRRLRPHSMLELLPRDQDAIEPPASQSISVSGSGNQVAGRDVTGTQINIGRRK
jgi:transcriptional regulator with XRE-family HTH domain